MRPATREEFEVAIICALPHEADAVEASFDETYDSQSRYYGKRSGDTNVYVNVWAKEASQLSRRIPGWVTPALVAGICGAVPVSRERIKISLGDIIISDSLIEYDFGRQYPDGFQRKSDAKSTLGRPSREIRTILSSLQTAEIGDQFRERIHYHLKALQAQKPVWRDPSTSSHEHTDEPLRGTDSSTLQGGVDEDTTRPLVHIGTMASGDTVMKSDRHRNRLAHVEGIIGFEMEGAGVWDSFPCLIIKGVCDYADS
ncbi:5'-methylthioadenosine/S-adenosylhomocysteine nucleosidase family protein [Aspergillus affinis]|uniref:5'-methylthioadenosine/S-adenosylhomocysteine nucleosidase family protein n=1 Tax=Aspergillus affinis TaxID=1070780 RepID=UPI0022FF0D79|nr:purine and uridine phosphorylase [Aspergillus affinis]KAI9045939.1 purine and uridine phosphorylase [Aspergillus affinis]